MIGSISQRNTILFRIMWISLLCLTFAIIAHPTLPFKVSSTPKVQSRPVTHRNSFSHLVKRALPEVNEDNDLGEDTDFDELAGLESSEESQTDDTTQDALTSTTEGESVSELNPSRKTVKLDDGDLLGKNVYGSSKPSTLSGQP